MSSYPPPQALLALFGILLISSLSFPYILYNGALYCNTTCADCVSALNNDTYSTIYLNSTLSSPGATCIDNPANFSNKTFDCQGYSITGDKTSSTYGIYLNSRTNATIRNCTIEAFYQNARLYHTFNSTVTNVTLFNASNDCAHLYNFTNSTFSNSTLHNCSHEGMTLDYSVNSTIANNTIYDSMQQAIEMGSSHYNTIEYNLFHGCDSGVDFHWIYDASTYNLIRNNTMYNVTVGIDVWEAAYNTIVNNSITGPYSFFSSDWHYTLIHFGSAIHSTDYCDNIVENNTGPGGLPIYFSNETVNWDGLVAAQIILCDADNSVVTNSIVNASGDPDSPTFAATIDLLYCDNVTVSHSALELGRFAAYSGEDLNITGNIAYSSINSGFGDYGSNRTYFSNNTAYNSTYTGFYISSNNVTMAGNTAYDNHYSGIALYLFSDYLNGFSNVNSTGANITSNTLHGNKLGGIMVIKSQNATIADNSIYSNGYDFVHDFYPDYDVIYAKDRYFGIYLGSTYNISLSGNTVNSNNYYGIAINDSNNITSTNDNVYENGISELIASATSASNISFTNLTVHPYGYPVISFPDELEANTAYTLKQVSPPTTSYPDSLSVVKSRMINITNITGTPTITSMTWSWTSQQEAEYDESTFDLWKYVTSWTDLNATLSTSSNTLNYTSIPMGAYGILAVALPEDAGSSPKEPECNRDSGCTECQYCSIANGKCMMRSTSECANNEDCAAGYECTACECVREDSGCLYDSGCQEGYECKDSSCVKMPPTEPEEGHEGEGGEEGSGGDEGSGANEGTAGEQPPGTGEQEPGEPDTNPSEPTQSQQEAGVPSASEGEGTEGGLEPSSEPLDLAGAAGLALIVLIVAGLVYHFHGRNG